MHIFAFAFVNSQAYLLQTSSPSSPIGIQHSLVRIPIFYFLCFNCFNSRQDSRPTRSPILAKSESEDDTCPSENLSEDIAPSASRSPPSYISPPQTLPSPPVTPALTFAENSSPQTSPAFPPFHWEPSYQFPLKLFPGTLMKDRQRVLLDERSLLSFPSYRLPSSFSPHRGPVVEVKGDLASQNCFFKDCLSRLPEILSNSSPLVSPIISSKVQQPIPASQPNQHTYQTSYAANNLSKAATVNALNYKAPPSPSAKVTKTQEPIPKPPSPRISDRKAFKLLSNSVAASTIALDVDALVSSGLAVCNHGKEHYSTFTCKLCLLPPSTRRAVHFVFIELTCILI